MIQIIVVCFLAFYFLPLAASFMHKRLMAGYFCVMLLVFIGLWGQHYYVTSDIDYIANDGAGDALGLAISVFITIAFVVGSLLALGTKILIEKYAKNV